MRRPGWSPVYVYVAVFGAVVAWGVTRHPPIAARANADVVVQASLTSPTQGGHPDLRRVVQRMVLR